MRDFPGGPIAKTPNSQCRGSGSIPGQATRLHMPQLKILNAAMKMEDFSATTKAWHSQIYVSFKKSIS